MGKPTIKHSEIRDVQFGENITVIEPVNLYDCKIGDNSFIGPLLRYKKELRLANGAEFSHTHSFVSWLRSEMTASSRMAQCSSTISLLREVLPEIKISGDQPSLATM